MTTLLYTHEACLGHDTGHSHPESIARLEALLKVLRGGDYAGLEWREAPRAEIDQLARVHDAGHISAVFDAIPESGRVRLDLTDTMVSPGSGEAALRAAGAVCAAVDAVAAGEACNAFCAVRPPGHHAEPSRTLGFCLFNNVAIGAEQVRAVHGYRRAAVVDFDVHHGNGTQAMFMADRDLFFASTHQSFIFPNTGLVGERGVGNIVNAPLARGWGGKEFRHQMREKVLPALNHFKPDFLLISAGFDAHIADPIGDLRLDNADFVWATRELMQVADKHCGGRIVSVLEGGYNPSALAYAAAAHVGALMAA